MGENLEGLVKFIYGTQAQYDAINSSNYDEDALYFLTDTNKLYKGSTLIANYVNERVIAAALVDLNNTATSLNTKITKNSTDIGDISTRLSDIGEVVQEEIQPLVGQISDISTKLNNVSSNLSELDEVFAAVANDLNSRITVNTNNLLNVSTNVAAVIVDVQGLQEDITEITDNLLEVSTNLLDVSTDLEELDFILATVGTQLDQRITDVSAICDQNYSQLNWIVINN